MTPFRYSVAATLALIFATVGCERETEIEIEPAVESADAMSVDMMSAPAAPAALSPADQAVEDFVTREFVPCGDSRFVPNGLGGFTEYRGFSYQTSSVPLTEADRLNGSEFMREVRFTFTSHRRYDGYQRSWSPWSPPDEVVQGMARLGGTAQLPYAPVRVSMQGGQLVAQFGERGSYFERTQVIENLAPRVDCSDIPGAASASGSRSPAPATPAASANSARGGNTEMRQGRESDLVFRRGTSSATVEGVVQGNEVRDYLFTARGGQNIRVNLTSESEADVTLTNGDGGRTLSEADGDDIEFRLPYSGRYRVRVTPSSGNGATPFSLYVEII